MFICSIKPVCCNFDTRNIKNKSYQTKPEMLSFGADIFVKQQQPKGVDNAEHKEYDSDLLEEFYSFSNPDWYFSASQSGNTRALSWRSCVIPSNDIINGIVHYYYSDNDNSPKECSEIKLTSNGYDEDLLCAVKYKYGYSTEQTEEEFIYVNDKKQPYILHKSLSDVLEGAYNVDKYEIGSCSLNEAMALIENGELKALPRASVSKHPDGSVELQETFDRNNCHTRRRFIKKGNNTQYFYKITDKLTGECLLDINRSFEQKSNNCTVTTINDTEYEALYDDKNMTITITDSKGHKKVINMLYLTCGFKTDWNEELFKYLKSFPADVLLNIAKCFNSINLSDRYFSGSVDAVNKELEIGGDLAYASHEAGHGMDLYNSPDKLSGTISTNPELKEIYDMEFEKFYREFPNIAHTIVTYFSPDGCEYKSDLGIYEFVAEANMLFVTYGHDSIKQSTRSHYLVEYFPKTIAKIAELNKKKNDSLF